MAIWRQRPAFPDPGLLRLITHPAPFYSLRGPRANPLPTPVTSDPLLKERASALRKRLNAGCTLRLFTNDITPVAATPLAAFQEAAYDGYGPINLAGIWGPVARVQGGEWAFQGGPFSWHCTGGAGQVLRGWYIGDGVDLLFAQRFDASINLTSGRLFKFALQPQSWSLSLLV